ncbi:MAG TPA: hypothetical protein V6D48_17635, partial [Oculatellaceae cyanobacterium]
MGEEDWVWGASLLAGLLAINFTLFLWQWYQPGRILANNWHQDLPEKISLFMEFTTLVPMLGYASWLLLRYVFVL